MQKTVALTFLPFMLGFIIHAQPAAQMKWLAGTWKITTAKGVMVEQWHIANDSSLKGRSFFLKNGTDTLLQETIDLVFRNGSWFYIPTVPAQNNAQPTSFKLLLLKGSEFISENPGHDFPQRISYRRINNQLFASIEGKKNGRYDIRHFDFIAE